MSTHKTLTAWDLVKKQHPLGLPTNTSYNCIVPDHLKDTEKNNNKIKKLISKIKIFDVKQLNNLLKNCKLIKELNIIDDIITLIVEYRGMTIIPVKILFSSLPWYHPRFETSVRPRYGQTTNERWEQMLKERKQYMDWLKLLYNQSYSTKNNGMKFTPKNVSDAGVEIKKYITSQLNNLNMQVGHSWEFKTYVNVYTLTDECKDIINEYKSSEYSSDKQNIIEVTLHNYYSSQGGDELLTRLYLEAVLDPEINEFKIDAKKVEDKGSICFDGYGKVLMFDGKYKFIKDLKIGDKLMSFNGNIATIEVVIKSIVNNYIPMVKLVNSNNNYCWITPEHPILMNNNGLGNKYLINNNLKLNRFDSDFINKYNLKWILPKHNFSVVIKYENSIYNFILDKFHVINVNNFWCCTLGHNYTGEIIEHFLWGNSLNIRNYIKSISTNYPDAIVN